MHTPNKGLSTCLRSVLCLLHVSYKSVPFPPFPSRFPFPLFPSLVPFQKQSMVFVTYMSPLLSKSVHSLPSSSLLHVPFPLSLLTIMFPLSFPIFDYAPTPFPYFWLCPDTLCPKVLMLLLQDCYECNFCAVSAWVYGPDNYYLCTKL